MTEAAGNSTQPTDDERMAAAVELVGSHPSPTSTAVLKNHTVHLRGRIVIVLIAAAVVGGLIGFLLGDTGPDGGGRAPVSEWRVVLGWTLWAVGVTGCVIAIVRMVRAGGFRRGRMKPLQVLTAGQRKGILRQIQGKDPVVDSQLPVSRLLAANLVVAAGNSRVSVSIVAVLAGNAVRSDDARPWYLVGILAAVMLLGAVAGRRQTERARAFLDAHATPTAPIHE